MNEYDAVWQAMGNANFLDFTPTGSREICNPPPTNTDYDIVCLTKTLRDAIDFLIPLGFELNSSQSYEIDEGEFDFDCFRMGEINLIVTSDPTFFKRWKFATKICKDANVMDKEDRIIIFQGFLYGRGL